MVQLAMNNNRIFPVIIFCFLAALPVRGQGTRGDSLDLATCIQLAWSNNYLATSSGLSREQAHIDHREARQRLIPSLEARFGHNLSQGRRIDLVTNQYINQRFTSGNQSLSTSATLFQGLAALHKIREQAAAYRASVAEEQSAREQVMLDVILAYTQVLTARDMLHQMELRLELTRQQVKRTSDLHDNGAILPADYYDLRGQYASDKNALNDLHKTYSEAMTNLARAMNVPADQVGPVRSFGDAFPLTTPDSLTADGLYDDAVLSLPTVKATELRILSSKAALKASRSAHSPRLTFGAGFESTYSSNSDQTYFNQTKNNMGRYLSFGLNIPIVDHLFVRNNVARSKIQLTDAELKAANTKNDLQRTISQSLINLRLAAENFKNLVEREENFQESFRIAKVRFEAGDLNSVLFLTAKNNMDQALADKIIGKYEWRLQQFIIDYYQGLLPWQQFQK
ncbi:TolC family protein [Ravibacter arvi]